MSGSSKETGTFQDLVKTVNPGVSHGVASKRMSCIRPYSGVNEGDWQDRKPTDCALYDAGNLVDGWPKGADVLASVGADCNDYINFGNEFFAIPSGNRGIQGAVLARKIKVAAGSGLTPIGSLIILGHSWMRIPWIGGAGNRLCRENHMAVPDGAFYRFDVSDLTDASGTGGLWNWQPDLAAATSGDLSPGCWFRNDAVVRLIGCYTMRFAGKMKTVLRSGAVVWGTNKTDMGF